MERLKNTKLACYDTHSVCLGAEDRIESYLDGSAQMPIYASHLFSQKTIQIMATYHYLDCLII